VKCPFLGWSFYYIQFGISEDKNLSICTNLKRESGWETMVFSDDIPYIIWKIKAMFETTNQE